MLSARLELPLSGEPSAYALFAHCFTCSKNIRAAVHVTRALSARGYGVVRFDFTGLGESEGDFADTNFTSNIQDLVAAARFMEEELEGPSLLVGHSLGGAAVLRAAPQIESVRAVATVGAPADPVHVLAHVVEDRDEIERTGEAEVRIGGRPFRIRRQFLDDLESQQMEAAVSGLGRPLLIFHSPIDDIVGIENAARLYEMARHPKSFVSLDRADHLLGDESDSQYVGDVLAAWASRYLPADASTEEPEDLGAADRVVTRTGTEGFRTDIRVRRHALTADEPISVGGEDAGPTPYDLLLAGLGACTSMTLQMYARRKGWPLQEARVRLRHRRKHANDCLDCATDPDPRLDVVDREVELSGDLDDEQRTRLLEIADRCPVHRTLEAGVHVRTTSGE